MLCERFDREFFVARLIDNRKSYLFPAASDREAWEKIAVGADKKQLVSEIIAAAETFIGQPWPQLSAALFSQFMTNGNRSNYENSYFMRRNNLGILVIAECLENQGRFIEEIVNGIWSILSEPCWNVPAHGKYLDGDRLPNPDQVWVDLFSAVTGMTLSLTMMLHDDALEKHSPALCKTVRQYLVTRIVEPIEQHPEYHGWMRGFNNWTPWCASNIIGTALYVIEDKKRIVDLIMQLLTPTDNFIATYGPDGGCDEGPGYWGVAGGKLLEQLEILNSVTGDALAGIYQEPLIRNMGEYISKVHLAGDYFMSPADAKPKCHPRPALIYRFGETTGSEQLKRFAMKLLNEDKMQITDRRFCGNLLLYTLEELFWLPDGAMNLGFEHETVTIFDDLEILIARENASGDGFILAAKGGHNAENHNHNDIGVFELFYDNAPVIIDIGVGSYTRQTFSPQRYDIWCIASGGHNVPLVNGQEQLPGAESKAEDVCYDITADTTAMALEISSAYSGESQLSTLSRKTVLDRAGKTVSVFDRAEFTAAGNNIVMPLYCLPEPRITGASQAEIAVNGKVLQLVVNTEDKLQLKVEKISIDDDLLRKSWGDCVYKLVIETASESDAISYSITIKEK